MAGAVLRLGGHGFRNYGVAAARAGEAGGLRERAELDGDVPRSVDFVNGARDVRLGDVGGISGVKKNDGVVFAGVVHPLLQFVSGERGARWVVRAAEVNHVRAAVGQRGGEAVFLRRGEIDDAFKMSVRAKLPRASRHDVRVEIDGIDGVGDCDDGVLGKNFLDIAAIAFRAVADENLVRLHRDAASSVIPFDDRVNQEIVALLRAVAAKGFLFRHFVDGGVHRLDGNRR